MASPLNEGASWGAAIQRRVAIVHERIGWPGWAGLFLVAASAQLGSLAQLLDDTRGSSGSRAIEPAPGASRASGEPNPASAEKPPQLAKQSDVPLLMTLMERAVIDSDLSWPGAEYSITPATDQALASLQVRFSLKAPYPKLRSVLTQLSKTVPGLVLHEVSLSRPGAQQADLDAKLSIGVLLDDERTTLRTGDVLDRAVP